MNLLCKSIIFTGFLALAAGSLQPCLADDTKAVAIQSASESQTYVGKITRTGINGKKTVGDITLNLTAGTGYVTANIITNGKAQVYFGTVMPVSRDTKAFPSVGRRRVGTLSRLRLSHVPLGDEADGFNNQGVRVSQLSVTFTKKGAFGGATTANGSTLEFTASRLGVAFGNQLPVGAIMLPVGAGGTIPVTGNGG